MHSSWLAKRNHLGTKLTSTLVEKSSVTPTAGKRAGKNRGWIALYALVIALWGIVFGVTIRSWILGTEALVDSVDLSLFTLPILAINLAFLAATFLIFIAYFATYRKAVREQRQAIEKWQRAKNAPLQEPAGTIGGTPFEDPYKPVDYPLCSIIIPARDEEQVIQNTILACLKQSYANIEVLIICHNCSDNTYAEAQKIKDVRVRPLELNTKESGKGIALNHGVANSKGDYILILDADGRLTENFVEDALPLFSEGGYSAVQGRYVPSNREYNFITRMLSLEGDLWSTPFMTFRTVRAKRAGLGGTGYIIKKDALHSVGGFINHLVDDYELTFRLLRKKYRIAFAPLCINYDEKPPTLDIMLKQRARWVKGFLDMMKSRVAERRDVFGHLFWMNPLTAFTSLALLIIAGFSTLHYIGLRFYPFQYAHIPISLWIGLTLSTLGLYTAALLMQYGKSGLRHAAWLPLYLPFANYYMVVAIKAFFVKSWADTKTVHGFTSESTVTKEALVEEKQS